MTLPEISVEVAGWIGAGLLLGAFAMVSSSRLKGNGLGFQLMNLFGAGLLLINTLYHAAYPASLLNGVWALVAVANLVRGSPSNSR